MTVEANAHTYLSTACHHGQHGYCSATDRGDGAPKVPGRCKFCPAPCVCSCHAADREQIQGSSIHSEGGSGHPISWVEARNVAIDGLLRQEKARADLADREAWTGEGCCRSAFTSEGNVHDHPVTPVLTVTRRTGDPVQTCQLCGRAEQVRHDARGFPPDIAKRRLQKACKEAGCPCEPTYTAGFDLTARDRI